MGFMTLFGAVLVVLFHHGATSKINGQRICRRGTERPCYKVSYIQDSQRRLTFEEARQACRADGGELLSIETESEQRLIERFIKQLQPGDGDFWIGLRRSPQDHRGAATSTGCPSQYYWLDRSRAKFRNWHWDEPSCGVEMCAALYHQPNAPPDEEGHFLFQWNDDNCSSKNNFVCKYSKEEIPAFTVPTMKLNILSTTETDKKIKAGLPESSDSPFPIHYILYATIPALLMLLIAVAGFFCYRQHRRKAITGSYPSRSKQWMSTAASPAPLQGPYAFSDITKLTHPPLDISLPADLMAKYPSAPAQDFQCGDYENVSCADRESGFVTNDIYETCRAQSQQGHRQVGWVENEIYA